MKSSQLITPYYGTIFSNVRLCSSKYTWYPRSNFDILEGKKSHSSRIRRNSPDLACKTYVLNCFNSTFGREILSDFQGNVLLWSFWSLISIKSCLPLTTITAVNFDRLLFVSNSTDKAFIVSVLMYVPFFVWWIKRVPMVVESRFLILLIWLQLEQQYRYPNRWCPMGEYYFRASKCTNCFVVSNENPLEIMTSIPASLS